MKRLKFILSIIVILFVSCQENKLESKGNRKIKYIKTVQYVRPDKNLEGIEYDGFSSRYRKDGKLIEKDLYNADGSLHDKWLYTYHKNGEIENEKYYRKKKLTRNIIYSYDEANNKIEEIVRNGKGKLLYRKTFDYTNGQNVKKTNFDDNNILSRFYLFIYDKNGNNTDYMTYRADSTLVEKYVSIYDTLNHVISTETFDGDGRLRYIEKYKYDLDGNKTETAIYDKERKFKNKTVRKYSDIHNIIESSGFDENLNILYTFTHRDTKESERLNEIWYDKDKKVSKIVKCEYTDDGEKLNETITTAGGSNDNQENRIYKYDKDGNWVECAVYRNDKPFVILKRDIKYY